MVGRERRVPALAAVVVAAVVVALGLAGCTTEVRGRPSAADAQQGAAERAPAPTGRPAIPQAPGP